MELFTRAKQVALSNLYTFLPDGRTEGDEYVCKNPTRADNSAGSFKINVRTGSWADFADDAAGNDCVSLYAYLNRDRLEGIVNGYKKIPKNFEGAVQVAAAREILEEYDPSYFPSDSDNFDAPTVKKGGMWDGWRQMTHGVDNPPDITESVTWTETHTDLGKCMQKWNGFVDKKGRTIFYVCRHVKDGKKKRSSVYLVDRWERIQMAV